MSGSILPKANEDPIVQAVYTKQIQLGLTDTQMGEVLGMGRTHYCEFRKGHSTLAIGPTKKAYQVLGISPEILLS